MLELTSAGSSCHSAAASSLQHSKILQAYKVDQCSLTKMRRPPSTDSGTRMSTRLDTWASEELDIVVHHSGQLPRQTREIQCMPAFWNAWPVYSDGRRPRSVMPSLYCHRFIAIAFPCIVVLFGFCLHDQCLAAYLDLYRRVCQSGDATASEVIASD